MRLNANTPDDNPMEKLFFCFGGDGGGPGGGGGGGGRDSSNPGNIGVGSGASLGATSNANFGGGGGGGGGDAFSASGGYVSSAISDFGRATGGTSNDRDRDGIPDTVDIDAGTGTGRPVGGVSFGGGVAAQSPVAPVASVRPTLVNQPLAVGAPFTAPYGSYQRSAPQMFSYGGLNASPYSMGNIAFAGGAPARGFSSLGSPEVVGFDMGSPPSQAGVSEDVSISDRIAGFFDDVVSGRPQRVGQYNPLTGKFSTFDGQTTLEKTSDNRLSDFAVNALNPLTSLTGFVDTADYSPLAGGETVQYSDFSGGLLSDFIGESLTPYSELNVSGQGDERGGDGGVFFADTEDRSTDDEEDEEEETRTVDLMMGEPYVPPQRQYQPFESNFYNIPQRFRSGLLG